MGDLQSVVVAGGIRPHERLNPPLWRQMNHSFSLEVSSKK